MQQLVLSVDSAIRAVFSLESGVGLGLGRSPTGLPTSSLLAQVNSIYENLDDLQRMRIFASLVVIVTALAFLVLFVLAAGRVTRWYVNRRPRATKLTGDPFPRVIDSKPRPEKRETKNWQRR